MNTNEEIIYCTNCGAVNKASAVVCCECEKLIRKRHYAFFTFLLANTKDKFKGDTKDYVIKKIENFLISHIYGTILTITIVTGAVAFAVPNNTYIKRVGNSGAQNNIATEAPAKVPVVTDLSDEERMSISRLEIDYQQSAEYALTGFDTYSDAPALSGLIAENAGVDFPYSTRHDMILYGTTSVVRNAAGENGRPSSATSGSMYRANGDLTSEFAKQLYNDGYEVAESVRECIGYFDGRVTDFTEWDNLPNPDIKFYYEMVYVKLNGKWYIAQDILVR